MPFIIGTPTPDNKILVQSVSHIYGIGLTESAMLCKKAGFGDDARGIHVTPEKSQLLESLVDNRALLVGADLRRFQNDKIRRLYAIMAYRGLRHKRGLPVRGQRTHTNAKKRIHFNINVN
uniref:Ribosomal protein S13 n=1 Tax=Sargassum confusum TaxID=74091 RepID=A0A3Q8R2N3_9PHAE|nr:ribosomal protein S13 [Sargassum confusum]AZJ16120.1 ribosomal protein S13 [Sargassum confusum]UVW81664.1 ribosomal protein S13 [Sargassum confusum]